MKSPNLIRKMLANGSHLPIPREKFLRNVSICLAEKAFWDMGWNTHEIDERWTLVGRRLIRKARAMGQGQVAGLLMNESQGEFEADTLETPTTSGIRGVIRDWSEKWVNSESVRDNYFSKMPSIWTASGAMGISPKFYREFGPEFLPSAVDSFAKNERDCVTNVLLSEGLNPGKISETRNDSWKGKIPLGLALFCRPTAIDSVAYWAYNGTGDAEGEEFWGRIVYSEDGIAETEISKIWFSGQTLRIQDLDSDINRRTVNLTRFNPSLPMADVLLKSDLFPLKANPSAIVRLYVTNDVYDPAELVPAYSVNVADMPVLVRNVRIGDWLADFSCRVMVIPGLSEGTPEDGREWQLA